MHMVCQNHELGDMVKYLNTNIVAGCKQMLREVTFQGELREAQDLSVLLELGWKMSLAYGKAVEHHLSLVAQQVTLAQAQFTHKKSSWGLSGLHF